MDGPPRLLCSSFFLGMLWEKWRGLTSVQCSSVLLPALTTTCQHPQLTAALKPTGSELSNQQSAVECRSELGVVDSIMLLLRYCALAQSVAHKGCV